MWKARVSLGLVLSAAGLVSFGAKALADGYAAKEIVRPSAFHGVHGLGIDKAGRLFAGSVVGQAIYEVDVKTGTAKVAVPPPQGMADDIAFASDGTMAWTGFLTGDIYAKKPDGTIKKLASGLPGINSIDYRDDGRLYATTVFLGDALYEIDPDGNKEPRKIMEKMGGLNGFEIRGGMLYGPLWFKGQVVKVDLDNATLSVIADGFKVPAAVNLDAQGNVWVVDTALGQLVKVDPKTGAKTVVAQLKTGLDNLAIAKDGKVFVSNMVDNGIQEVDPATGAAKQIIEGQLAIPGGLAVVSDGGKDTVYVADVFAFRAVDGGTGEVKTFARMQGDTLEYPMSATAKGDHVILSSWFTGTIQVFDRKTGKSLGMIHELKAPFDAVETAPGAFLVNELGTGSLVKLSGEHGKDRTIVAKDLQGPMGLAVADTTAFVTEAMAGTVDKIDLGDGKKTVVAQGLKVPTGLALMPNGNLAVVEAGAKRVIEVDTHTGAISEIAKDLHIGLPPAGKLPVPNGIAVGAGGAIYVSSDIDNSIYRITRN